MSGTSPNMTVFLSSFLRHNEVSRTSEVQGGCGAVLLMSGFCGCFKKI
jgi:Ca2+/Na+ antiporter